MDSRALCGSRASIRCKWSVLERPNPKYFSTCKPSTHKYLFDETYLYVWPYWRKGAYTVQWVGISTDFWKRKKKEEKLTLNVSSETTVSAQPNSRHTEKNTQGMFTQCWTESFPFHRFSFHNFSKTDLKIFTLRKELVWNDYANTEPTWAFISLRVNNIRRNLIILCSIKARGNFVFRIESKRYVYCVCVRFERRLRRIAYRVWFFCFFFCFCFICSNSNHIQNLRHSHWHTLAVDTM